jgi:hypothetical protein
MFNYLVVREHISLDSFSVPVAIGLATAIQLSVMVMLFLVAFEWLHFFPGKKGLIWKLQYALFTIAGCVALIVYFMIFKIFVFRF